jgi:polysaccharide lyase-like protein
MIHRLASTRAASSVGSRTVLGCRRTRLVGPAGLALIALACSAPESGDGDDDLPEYSGMLNPGAGGTTSTPNPVGANGGSGQAPVNPVPGNNEQMPGNLPVGSNGGSGNVAPGNGSAGSAAAGSGNPGTAGTGGANGAAGSSMVGTAGNGSMPNPGGAGGGGGEEPPEVLPGGFYLIDDFEGSSSSMRIDSNNAFHTMLQFALPQAVRDANEVFGRVFLRLAATPSAAHFIWVEVGTAQNDQHEMRLGHNVGQLQSNHFLNGEQDIRDQSRALVANQFYCLEFQMDNNPEQLRVWLDGEETALSTTNYTAGPGAQGNGNAVADFIPPLEAFRIGWELQNGTVWFDDVALANARIGCD